MKGKITFNQKNILLQVSAYLVSIGSPITAAFILFPDQMIRETHNSVSLAFVLTLIICLSVFRKKITAAFENAPVLIVWVVIFAISFVAKSFVDQMFAISIAGVAGNLGSMPLFKIAEKNKELADTFKEMETKKKLEKQLEGKK